MAVLAAAASLSQKWEPGRIQLPHAAAEAAAAQEGIGMSTDSIILFFVKDLFYFFILRLLSTISCSKADIAEIRLSEN